MTEIIEKNLLSQRVNERTPEVTNLSISASADLKSNNASGLYSLAATKGKELSGRVLVVDRNGIVQTDSFSTLNGNKIMLREVIEVLTGIKDVSYGYHQIHAQNGESFWAAYYTAAIIENSETIGAMVLSQSVQDVVDNTAKIRSQFLIAELAAAILIGLFTYLITNHITLPLEKLQKGAMNIAAGNYSTRVHITGKDEIAQLGNAFNQMSEQLENVDKRRNEFVSNASHELKTPLAAMKILTESILYQDGIEEEIYKDFLGDINEEIDRLTHLINDLLLLTKLEEAEQILKIQRVDLAALAEEAAKRILPIATQKNIEIEVKYDAPVFADCDRGTMQQVISNLIDNAVKYSFEHTKVTVTVSKNSGNVSIAVKDKGEGIASEHISQIFDRFYRVDKARSRETGGSGLGLYIAWRIVSAHNGKIDIKSKPGEGSVFTVLIPGARNKLENRESKQ